MITLEQYWMGRDAEYPLAMTPAIRSNAVLLVDLLNAVIEEAEKAGLLIPVNPETGSQLSSGWRPPAVNAAKGGAKMSRHMTGQAGDIYSPGCKLGRWLMARPEVMRRLGLWMEHPDKTPTWCHLQSVPPGSGNRVFWP